ncbi:hypothetical protein B9Z19DRAFT_1127577 [Tuber borchii]|uniref:TPR-like protein n=1 Tax=Tuber borchii TaxID=42251 RepID=A0A2T6ZR51_TUBBO|nr:hypothetical protein B9Z19DRAFT_1127577 [Tuber borchii]
MDRIQKLVEDKAWHSRIALCGLGGSGKTEIALEYVYRKRGQCHIFWVHGSELLKFSEDYEYILECTGVLRRIDNLGPLEGTSAVDALIGALDRLPLAVAGAAAFMTEKSTWPYEYWEIFQESGERRKDLLLRKFREIHREADMAFHQLKQQMPTAASLLHLISFFDHQNIPEDLLLQSVTRSASKLLYELHRLVQQSVQVYFSYDETSHWREVALEVIWRVFPDYDHNVRHVCAAYLPHAVFVTQDSADAKVTIAMRRFKLDDVLRFGEPENINRRALEIREKALGPQHLDTLTTIDHLAIVLRKLGKYDEAERMHRRALEGTEQHLGPDHITALARVDSLARVGCEKGLGSEHPETISRVYSLALVLCRRGKWREAMEMSKRLVEGREKTLGPEHPDTLAGASGLALVLRRLEKYGEVEKFQHRAQNLGKNGEAEKKHRAVLKSREKVLGRSHHNTIATASNLASVLNSQGNRDEGAEMFRRALEGYENEPGPDHPDTFFSLYKLALVLHTEGNYSEEAKLHRHAVEIRKRTLGPEHHSMHISIARLAKAFQAMKNYEAEKLPYSDERGKLGEARKIYRQVFEMREKHLGPDHPPTLSSGNNLALALQEIGMYAQPEAMLRRVLEGWEKELEPDDLKQRTCIRRALEDYEKVLGPEHPETLLAIDELAATLEGLEKHGENLGALREDTGRLCEAEQDYQRVYEGHCEIQGKDHPDTTLFLKHLSSLRMRLPGLVGAADIETHETNAGAEQKATAAMHVDTVLEANLEAAAKVTYNSPADTNQDSSPAAETINTAKSEVVETEIGLPAAKPVQDKQVLTQTAAEAHKKSGRRIRLIQRLFAAAPVIKCERWGGWDLRILARIQNSGVQIGQET